MINSGTLDYKLDVLQISSVQDTKAESSYNKVLIASLIAIVLVVTFLGIYYRLGGLVSSVALVFDIFLSLTLFVFFKGVINQQMIAALILSIGIAVDALIVLFERINHELYMGKNIERALSEGYKKSINTIVDANIVILIMSIVMFFLGNSVASFSLMLALSSVCSLLVIPFISKLLLSYLVNIKSSKDLFGAKRAYLENKEEYT